MTDRELLELAAKAAGIKGFRYVNNEPIQGGYRTGLWSDLYEDFWNPLTDDGDALRLAVKLRLEIVRNRITDARLPVVSCHKIYVDVHEEERWQWEFDEAGPYAATRRAITRAAAEIGRNML